MRHSRYSTLRLQGAREALGLLHSVQEDFAKQVAELCSVKVSEGDWAKFLDELAPLPEAAGRGRTIAENKRDDLSNLWVNDERVAPWRGTAFGAVQAVNTYAHWNAGADKSRQDRNAARAVTGKVDELDRETLTLLRKVLA